MGKPFKITSYFFANVGFFIRNILSKCLIHNKRTKHFLSIFLDFFAKGIAIALIL